MVEGQSRPAAALLRLLPSVERVMADPRMEAMLARTNRPFLVDTVRIALADLRAGIVRGERTGADAGELLDAVVARVGAELSSKSTVRTVINATGVVLHTNLGRAQLAEAAAEAAAAAARSAVALEYDLERGARGERDGLVEPLLCQLTGAEAATVVNNNAAALLLALNTLAEGREVIVSRGELIEIGGSFRLPEVMAKSGAVLREVGTTNRTHLRDYERAVGAQTGLLLKVHTSNYRIVGFSASVSLEALVALGRETGVPVMEDLGSGALLDLGRFGLPREPVVAESIGAGADLVSFSGDKLLGGPQAGILVGRGEIIERLRKNPLRRAIRPCKLTLSALAATLDLYLRSADIVSDLPTLRGLCRPVGELRELAAQAAALLSRALGDGFTVRVEDSTVEAGSGSLPTESIPSVVVSITSQEMSVDTIAGRFRRANPPIIGRIQEGRFLLDVRLIDKAQDLVPRWE